MNLQWDVPCKLCREIITADGEAKHCGEIVTVAVMVGVKRFEYGISGVFEFEQELGLSAGDQVCNQCLGKHKFHPVKSVVCDGCGKTFQPVSAASKDGYGCAGEVIDCKGDLMVSCGWGSKYDDSRFLANQKWKVGQVVCDDCVSELF